MNRLALIGAIALVAAPTETISWVVGGGDAIARPARVGGGGGGVARAGGGGRIAQGGAGAGRPAGGMGIRSSSNANIGNRGGNMNGNRNNNNRNINNNVNRNVNVNNVNVNRGYYGGGGGCYGCGWDNNDGFGAGLAVGAVTGAVVGAAAASSHSTTVVVSPGSVVTTLPSGCGAVAVNGMTYQRCGSVWYEPRYVGSSVQYVVVNQP
ncbi:MAG TPA: hypothetical protein VF503_08675 [Sphingobium sp.]|uniref:hypothetical protein n=1 Tax=Sphingobium sp. TaxID=1912891 RepID=UPI002ED3AE4B